MDHIWRSDGCAKERRMAAGRLKIEAYYIQNDLVRLFFWLITFPDFAS